MTTSGRPNNCCPMETCRGAIATSMMALVLVLVVLVGATGYWAYDALPRTTHSPRTTVIVSSSASCDQPAYLLRLASEVEQTQSFAQQSHGLSYELASGDNQSAQTGTVDGKPSYYPPETSLALYSYGTTPTAFCPSVLGIKGVVGALWIRVPINRDGSYDLGNMSIYFTAGVFTNSTASP
jgi:hypothetical protein